MITVKQTRGHYGLVKTWEITGRGEVLAQGLCDLDGYIVANFLIGDLTPTPGQVLIINQLGGKLKDRLGELIFADC